jgi:hypothetical protein
MNDETERQRGPLEEEVHNLMRTKGLGGPALLKAQLTGQMPTVEERMLQAERMDFILMEGIERVAVR